MFNPVQFGAVYKANQGDIAERFDQAQAFARQKQIQGIKAEVRVLPDKTAPGPLLPLCPYVLTDEGSDKALSLYQLQQEIGRVNDANLLSGLNNQKIDTSLKNAIQVASEQMSAMLEKAIEILPRR